ncbi:TIGR02186 family protein [Rhodovulum sp. DZ06]|uniref:TIGR02186 family protein n=1 Tax=Rhodovulum sp. DZ06 TaxID=3425126 RepID=UPI003D33064E
MRAPAAGLAAILVALAGAGAAQDGEGAGAEARKALDAAAGALEAPLDAARDAAGAAADAAREALPLAQPPGVAAQEAEAQADPLDAEGAGRSIVAALSQNRVSITADFSGSQIFVFGAVKRTAPSDEPLQVIVTIAGPSAPELVRRKDRVAGVWANTDEVLIDEAPSFYAVASSHPVEEILSFREDLKHRIGINQLVSLLYLPEGVAEPESFREAVIRIRRNEGLYVELPRAVEVVEDTLFAVDVNLPANLVEGDYRARVFLLGEQEVQDVFETDIAVRKVGLERWLYALSRESPAAYGLLSIFIALTAGWGASEVFRLMRR